MLHLKYSNSASCNLFCFFSKIYLQKFFQRSHHVKLVSFWCPQIGFQSLLKIFLTGAFSVPGYPNCWTTHFVVSSTQYLVFWDFIRTTQIPYLVTCFVSSKNVLQKPIHFQSSLQVELVSFWCIHLNIQKIFLSLLISRLSKMLLITLWSPQVNIWSLSIHQKHSYSTSYNLFWFFSKIYS